MTATQPHSNFCFKKFLSTEQNHNKCYKEATLGPLPTSAISQLVPRGSGDIRGHSRLTLTITPKTLHFLLSIVKLKVTGT